jgi:hypothetical protein
LSEIADHEWFRVAGEANPLPKKIKKQAETIQQLRKCQPNLDPRVVNTVICVIGRLYDFQIEQLGYQKEYVLKCLQKQSLCHINALYQALLLQKKQ